MLCLILMPIRHILDARLPPIRYAAIAISCHDYRFHAFHAIYHCHAAIDTDFARCLSTEDDASKDMLCDAVLCCLLNSGDAMLCHAIRTLRAAALCRDAIISATILRDARRRLRLRFIARLLRLPPALVYCLMSRTRCCQRCLRASLAFFRLMV